MNALRVLIAEGDTYLQQDFREYLEGLGYRAEVVGDCAGCLDRLRGLYPHALLIDSDLPGGVERILSLVDRVRSVRHVIVMGGESSEQITGLMQRTSTCTLKKPFRLQALANVLA